MTDKIKRIRSVLPLLKKVYDSCELCARKCGANRTKGEKGYCNTGTEAVLFNYGPHFGEEPVISGRAGSGTVFFSYCSMGCVYCQNYEFSQMGRGKRISTEELASIFLELQHKGCHNINLVNPTHYMPNILEALENAFSKGLKLPIVYNTGGYDSLELIEKLDGIIDVYLTDIKYSEDEMSKKYSNAGGYVDNSRQILTEMYRQNGNTKIENDLIYKGLIVRLLILPRRISGACRTLEYIAENLSNNINISLMSQYYPVYKAKEIPELARRISFHEYKGVKEKTDELCFLNGWFQPFQSDFDPKLAGDNIKHNI